MHTTTTDDVGLCTHQDERIWATVKVSESGAVAASNVLIGCLLLMALRRRIYDDDLGVRNYLLPLPAADSSAEFADGMTRQSCVQAHSRQSTVNPNHGCCRSRSKIWQRLQTVTLKIFIISIVPLYGNNRSGPASRPAHGSSERRRHREQNRAVPIVQCRLCQLINK
jgi:hypothetical protein